MTGWPPCAGDVLAEAVGVISPVGDDFFASQPVDQAQAGAMSFCCPGPRLEADRQAQRIDYGMEFGAEAAARAAESLGFRSPLLRRAPAACA